MAFAVNTDSIDTSSEDTRSFEPLPSGDYEVVCQDITVKDFDWGTAFDSKFQVISGEHKGRLVWDFMTVESNNPEWQARGQKKLAQWVKAAGLPPQIDDTNYMNLKNKPVMARLYIAKAKEGYKPKNAIGEFRVTGAAQAAPAAKPAPAEDTRPMGEIIDDGFPFLDDA